MDENTRRAVEYAVKRLGWKHHTTRGSFQSLHELEPCKGVATFKLQYGTVRYTWELNGDTVRFRGRWQMKITRVLWALDHGRDLRDA